MTTLETKRLLLAKKSELSSRQVLREDIAIVKNAEVLDEIQQAADRTLALDLLTRNWSTAALLSEALQRLENGTYGTCAECDNEISPKRLAAIPWAKYCIVCQQKVDNSTVDAAWPQAA